MRLSPIVAHLRAHCPTFSQRVSGGIDWDAVAESAKLQLPAAYVIATADAATPCEAQNSLIQGVTDQFNVVVVLEPKDERGQEANDLLHGVRAELWRALVGWRPAPEYTPIQYGQGALLHISRARVVFQFGFLAEFQLGRNRADQPAETWQEYELDGLPALEGINIAVDFIDPMADKNLAPTGPDGRIELTTREDFS